MPQPNRCEICGEPTERPVDMCRSCTIDYELRARDAGYSLTGDVIAALLWAARRARWYAERRAAKNARAAVEREGRKAMR